MDCPGVIANCGSLKLAEILLLSFITETCEIVPLYLICANRLRGNLKLLLSQLIFEI